MTPITTDQVWAELLNHKGKGRGIHVRDLVVRVTGQSASCNVLERRIRTLISDLRLEGQPICGHPATGYFVAETAEELDEACKFLQDRAMSSLQLMSRMRHTSMPELLGQLSIAITQQEEGVPHGQ